MKILQGKIPVWVWCIPLATAVLITFLMSQPKIKYDTVTWKLDLGEDPEPYTTFLTNLRRTLRAEEVCKFPAMVIKPSKAKEFVFVDIINTEQKTVTLLLQGNDSYFLGYRDMFNGKERANFVDDFFELLERSDLFPNAPKNNRLKLPFKSSYHSMENVADLGTNGRRNHALGIHNLNSIINTVYGVDYQSHTKPKDIGQELAKFGLMVVQMVSEAARFIPIEKKMVAEGLGKNNCFKPDEDFVNLENAWSKICQAIHISAAEKPPCVKVNKLKYPPDVDTVDGLRPFITLLKFKKN